MIRLVDGDKIRLHFNRHGAAPLVWCVTILDEYGLNLEIACKGFRSYSVPLETIYRPKETPDDDDGLPSAWLAPVQMSQKVLVTVNETGWVDLQRPPGEKA